MIEIQWEMLCALPRPYFLILNLGLFAFAGFFFYRWYRSLLRSRSVSNTPLSKIRSAHQGYAELEGVLEPNQDGAIRARLSGRPCVWYQYRIQHRNRKGAWETIETGSSTNAFAINDGTGVCYVLHEGQPIHPPIPNQWRGRSRQSSGIPDGLFARLFGTFGRYQFTEWRLEPGDPIYALGNFLTIRDDDRHHGTQTQYLKQAVSAWDQKRTHYLDAFKAIPLFRASNRDDKLMNHQAQNEVLRQLKAQQVKTINVLSCVNLDSRQPFILATKSQRKIIRGFQWDSLIWLVGYVMSFSVAMFMLTYTAAC